MTNRQSSGSGKNGSGEPIADLDLKKVLQQYLDGIDPYLTEQEGKGENPADTNPTSSIIDTCDCEGPIQLQYHGQYRTTTGVVRIMRENGNTESADLLEELRRTQESARLLLNQLQDLHKRKTGTYHRMSKKTTQSGS